MDMSNIKHIMYDGKVYSRALTEIRPEATTDREKVQQPPKLPSFATSSFPDSVRSVLAQSNSLQRYFEVNPFDIAFGEALWFAPHGDASDNPVHENRVLGNLPDAIDEPMHDDSRVGTVTQDRPGRQDNYLQPTTIAAGHSADFPIVLTGLPIRSRTGVSEHFLPSPESRPSKSVKTQHLQPLISIDEMAEQSSLQMREEAGGFPHQN